MVDWETWKYIRKDINVGDTVIKHWTSGDWYKEVSRVLFVFSASTPFIFATNRKYLVYAEYEHTGIPDFYLRVQDKDTWYSTIDSGMNRIPLDPRIFGEVNKW